MIGHWVISIIFPTVHAACEDRCAYVEFCLWMEEGKMVRSQPAF